MATSYRKVSPSIEDIEIYTALARQIIKAGSASFHDVAKRLRRPVSGISSCLDRLESRYGALVNRQKSGENQLTSGGISLFEQFERIWSLHQTIGIAPTAEVSVATTNSILV